MDSGERKFFLSDTSLLSTALLYIALLCPPILAIVGSRSLSRIAVGPVFLYDVAMIAAFLSGLLLFFFFRETWRLSPWLLLMLILPAWALLRFFQGDFSLDSLRELHPFFYLLYAFLVASLAPAVRNDKKIAIRECLLVALFASYAFVSLRTVWGSFGVEIEGKIWSDIFSVRKDIDGWIIGLVAAVVYLLARRSVHNAAFARIALYLIPVLLFVQVSALNSRASQLGAFAMLSVAVILDIVQYKTNGTGNKWMRRTAPGIGVLVLAISVPFSVTEEADRWAGGLQTVAEVVFPGEAENETVLDSSPASPDKQGQGDDQTSDTEVLTEAEVGGAGTVRARLNAWSTLATWMFSEWSRALVGVGMGSDYWVESGTAVALLGHGMPGDGVNDWPYNWPHNFVLSVFAILGLPAAIFFVTLTVIGWWRLFKFASQGDVLGEIALLILTGLVTVSLFGVVFENPFGSLPYAWALGVAFGASDSLRRPGVPTSTLKSPSLTKPAASESR